jgi:hypothetical protein
MVFKTAVLPQNNIMTYKYNASVRKITIIILISCLLFVVFGWVIDRGDDNYLLFATILSLIFGPGVIVCVFILFMLDNWVRLDDHSMEIKFLWMRDTILLSEIIQIKKKVFVFDVYTQNGRYRIDRGMFKSEQLFDHLNQVVTSQKTQFITDPLPRQLDGKKSNFITQLGFSLFLLLFGVSMASLAYFSDGPSEIVLTAIAGLVPIGISLFFIAELIRKTPRRLRFEYNKIILDYYVGQKIHDPQNINHAYIKTNLLGPNRSPNYSLVIQFKPKDIEALEIKNSWFNEHTFQLLDFLIYHYDVVPLFEKQEENIKPGQFAFGSKKPFSYYLTRQSQVHVNSITEICDWLRQCKYIHDQEQFRETDVWTHPVDFETSKRGDCEDHSLWAWRKLIKLGYETDLVLGYMKNQFGEDGYHAWVTYEENGRSFLIEPTRKAGPMIFPLKTKSETYRPLFSVNQNLKTYRY